MAKLLENKMSKLADSSRGMDERDREFCLWYTGMKIDENGVATELDPVGSALRAGFTNTQAQNMRARIRNDPAIQMQLAILNRQRRGETASRLESYARRSADIAMELAEESEADNVRLGAAKLLMQVGGLGADDEDTQFRKKQNKANEEFRSRLEEIKDVLGSKEVSFEPFEEQKPIVDAELKSEDSKIDDDDEDDIAQ